jgi:hypothetical protein
VFLAVLYLFFLRVLRAVWVEMREPRLRPAPIAPDGTGSRPAASHREKLVIVSPAEKKGMEFPLGEEVTVGRAGGCAVLLQDDSFISQLHARMFRRDGELFVEDLGSTNGTYLNNRKVTAPVPVRKGDKIQFGQTTLELRR